MKNSVSSLKKEKYYNNKQFLKSNLETGYKTDSNKKHLSI